jgi:hypothetical protein
VHLGLLGWSPLSLKVLNFRHTQFVRGDLGRDLFHFCFAPRFSCSSPDLGFSNPPYMCASESNPNRSTRVYLRSAEEPVLGFPCWLWCAGYVVLKNESALCLEGL